ncbi:MAG TPA: hypothetical protein VF164_09725 [Trueperaceae bacterium]
MSSGPQPDPGDRLLELYAEAERRYHRLPAAEAPRAPQDPPTRRFRAHALHIPQRLWLEAKRLAQLLGVHLVMGDHNEITGRRTVYVHPKAAEQLLHAIDRAAAPRPQATANSPPDGRGSGGRTTDNVNPRPSKQDKAS